LAIASSPDIHIGLLAPFPTNSQNFPRLCKLLDCYSVSKSTTIAPVIKTAENILRPNGADEPAKSRSGDF
jgi:hypothetical protein